MAPQRFAPPPPPEAMVQDLRLGQGKMYVLTCSATVSLGEQARSLFLAIETAVTQLGGWLIDDMLYGSTVDGFSRLMERRENGELAWERTWAPASVALQEQHVRGHARKLPYTMLAGLGYPCWALEKHLYTIDVFNPVNELMLPYEEQRRRCWAIYTTPPTFVMPDPMLSRLLCAAATAVGSDYAFGGQWLPQAVYAYRFAEWSDNNYLKPLSSTVKLTDMSYAHMLLPRKDVAPAIVVRLLGDEFLVRRAGRAEMMKACELVGQDEEYLLLRFGALYPDANDTLAALAAELLGRPYVKNLIVRDAP